MRVEEITETKEVVVKKLYIANDGTVFNNEEDCKKHEKTTELMSEYNKLVKGNVNEFDLFFEVGNVDYSYDIVEVKNENDIKIVNNILSSIKNIKKSQPEKSILLPAKKYIRKCRTNMSFG